MYCKIVNQTKDTVLLNRGEFLLVSGKEDYTREPFYRALKGGRIVKESDLFKIIPNDSIDYVFSFRSANSFSKEEYSAVTSKDTVSFFYSNKSRKEKIFDIIAQPY